jgi:hypothetical protein
MIRLLLPLLAALALSGCFFNDNDSAAAATPAPAAATPLDALTPAAEVAVLDEPPAADALPADLLPPQ